MVAAKPTTKPNWISSTIGSIIAPDLAKRIFGFTTEKPPYQFFNWFWNLTSTWIDYVDEGIVTKEDILINIDSEADFNAAMLFLKNLVKNDHFITISHAGTGYAPDYNKAFNIEGITGSGTIVILDSYNLSNVVVKDCNNAVAFTGTIDIKKPLSVAKGVDIRTCAYVRFSTLLCSHAESLTVAEVINNRLINVVNSTCILTSCTVDADYDVESAATIFPTNYVISILERSNVTITTGVFKVTDGAASAYAKAFIELDSTSNYYFTSANYADAEFTYGIPVASDHYDFNMVMVAYNTTQAATMEAQLELIKVVNGQLTANFNDTSTKVRSGNCTLSHIGGRGTIEVLNLEVGLDKRFVIDRCSVPVNIWGVNCATATTDGALRAVNSIVNIYNTAYGKVVAADSGNTISIVNSTAYIAKYEISATNTELDCDKHIKCTTRSKVTIASIDTLTFGNAIGVLFLDSAAEVKVLSCNKAADPAYVRAEINAGGCVLIARDSLLAFYQHLEPAGTLEYMY